MCVFLPVVLVLYYFAADSAFKEFFVNHCQSAVLCLRGTGLCTADDFQYYHQLSVWQDDGSSKQKFKKRDAGIIDLCKSGISGGF